MTSEALWTYGRDFYAILRIDSLWFPFTLYKRADQTFC